MRKHYKLNELVSLDQMHDEIIHKIQILNNDAKKHNENLPGLGGVFNVVNLQLYHYGGNNPVKYTDPDGRDIEVSRKYDGVYEVVGGTQNNDTNIYIKENGKRTGDILGKMFTNYSFFDGGQLVMGSIINTNDSSGKEFINDIKNNTPNLSTYAKNATNNQHYDFKARDKENKGDMSLNQYHHRGRPLEKDKNGKTVYGTARDVGNYGAGYVTGKNGLGWLETRLGFDGYQIISDIKNRRSIGVEGHESQKAQFKGWLDGYTIYSESRDMRYMWKLK